MSNGDFSRWLEGRDTRYTGVRLQQGRILTDHDFNAADFLGSEQGRRANTAIVGASGSWNSGFRIGEPQIVSGRIDFDIEAGSLFVGGILLETEGVTYAAQPDWPMIGDEDLEAPAAARRDLAYLEVWEQEIGAVEDEELKEVALGGPDTTARVLPRWRVRLVEDVEADCHEAWHGLVNRLQAAEEGLYDPATGELATDCTLTVDFEDPEVEPGDLCNPPSVAGYLGAENHAIRVQLLGEERMIWGYDNGAALYRARRIERESDGTHVVELLNDPVDEEHWPISGEVVEVLRPDGRLPNGEWSREEVGTFVEVDSSYRPDTRTLVLPASTELDDAFSLTEPDYVYLRVWRQDQAGRDEGVIDFASGDTVQLGNTGIRVTLDGTHDRAGLYWTVSARPHTRDVVVPWSLQDGREPLGTRRWIAPLGIISWNPGAESTAHDCRRKYRRLVDDEGCCTVTVGDGTRSHGDVDTIAQAVALIGDRPGRVCLLRGVHEESVTISGTQNLTFEGCGPNSVWRAPEDQPALMVTHSQQLTIRSLRIEGSHFPALVALATKGSGVNGIHIEHVQAVSQGSSCVLIRFASNVRIEDSRFESVGLSQMPLPCVFVSGDYLHLVDNLVVGRPGANEVGDTGASAIAWTRQPHGGIQIGGQSSRVKIERNTVIGGYGSGITLGSAIWIADDNTDSTNENDFGVWTHLDPSSYQADPSAAAVRNEGLIYTMLPLPPVSIDRSEDGCIDLTPGPRDIPDDSDEPRKPASEGAVTDVLIRENTIEQMGGYGVYGLYGSGSGGTTLVMRIDIRSNRIEGNGRLQVKGAMPPGGIFIPFAIGMQVRGNDILENGGTRAGVGIFTFMGYSVDISENRIIANGRPSQPPDERPFELSGGVLVMLAVIMPELGGDTSSLSGASPGFALRVSNNVVRTVEGPALLSLLWGDAVVEGNQLESFHNTLARLDTPRPEGANRDSLLPFAGGTVNLITSKGLKLMSLLEKLSPGKKKWNVSKSDTATLGGANVRFHNNNVLLGADAEYLACVLIGSNNSSMTTGNHITTHDARAVATILNLAESTILASNRVEELTPGRQRWSGITVANLFNTNTDNQGHFCFVATGPADLVFRDNLSLDPRCRDDGKLGELLKTMLTVFKRWENTDDEDEALEEIVVKGVKSQRSKLNLAEGAQVISHHAAIDPERVTPATLELGRDSWREIVALENERKNLEYSLDLRAELAEDAHVIAGVAEGVEAGTMVELRGEDGKKIAEAKVDKNGRYRIVVESIESVNAPSIRLKKGRKVIKEANLRRLRTGVNLVGFD